MDNCIFCKIINNQIPSYKVYEDDYVLAFLDMSQTTKGHTLVIPKKHYANLLECSDVYLSKVMKVAKRIAQSSMSKLGANGVNILTNVNEIAGQSVFHFHVHVIFRYDDTDGIEIKFANNFEKYKDEMSTLAADIKASI